MCQKKLGLAFWAHLRGVRLPQISGVHSTSIACVESKTIMMRCDTKCFTDWADELVGNWSDCSLLSDRSMCWRLCHCRNPSCFFFKLAVVTIAWNPPKIIINKIQTVLSVGYFKPLAGQGLWRWWPTGLVRAREASSWVSGTHTPPLEILSELW